MPGIGDTEQTEQAMMSAHEEPCFNRGERGQTIDKLVSRQGSWECRKAGPVVGTLSPTVIGISAEENTRPHTHLYTELTPALFPVARRRNNPNVQQLKHVHPHSGMLSDNRNEVLTCYNMEEPSKHYDQRTQPVIRWYHLLL